MGLSVNQYSASSSFLSRLIIRPPTPATTHPLINLFSTLQLHELLLAHNYTIFYVWANLWGMFQVTDGVLP